MVIPLKMNVSRLSQRIHTPTQCLFVDKVVVLAKLFENSGTFIHRPHSTNHANTENGLLHFLVDPQLMLFSFLELRNTREKLGQLQSHFKQRRIAYRSLFAYEISRLAGNYAT